MPRWIGREAFLAAVTTVGAAMVVAPRILIALLAMRWLPGPHRDPETHYRACGYVLRGLREPRCPECNERI